MISDKNTRKDLNIYNHFYKIIERNENQSLMQIFILLYCASINMLTCIYTLFKKPSASKSSPQNEKANHVLPYIERNQSVAPKANHVLP